MFTLMVLLSEENLVLQAKKGALCTLGSNRIIWPYLECGAGVLTRKLLQIFLFFAFMVKKCLLTYFMMKFIIKMALVYAMVLSP